MARKNNRRILSGGVIILCIVLCCALDISTQAQIIARKKTFTISGSVTVDGVGLDGVQLIGFPGDPVFTDQNGNYSKSVDFGWRGTIRPEKKGYTFKPATLPFAAVKSNMSNQNIAAEVITFTISGRTDMEGVVMTGLPGNPVTGSDGTYKATVPYGWGGIVAPEKEGYVFKPSSKPYDSVTINQTNQNYTGDLITFTISGSTGVEGVTLQGLPGNPATGRNGFYSVSVKYGWSGTVRPTKAGYTFDPVEIPYNEIMNSYSNQDYLASMITYTISGSAGMDGVEMKGLPDGLIVYTDASGYYSATVAHGWTGTIKPEKPGYKFVPATLNFSNVTSNRENQNVTGTPIILTISGSTGLDDVTMEGLPGNPVTSGGGQYSVQVDWGWSGTVTPIIDGYEFDPPTELYTAITENIKQNYSAKMITYTISGSVGVPGVTLKGLPGRPVTSNNDGTYSVDVNYNWSGTITPAKEGYTFSPPSIEYTNVLGPEMGRDYIPTLLKRAISGRILTDKGEPAQGIMLIAEGAGSVQTDANGEYELLVDHGWQGALKPLQEGYTFKPSQKPYSIVTRDIPNQNFSAVLQMFTISDRVLIGTTPIPGVQISANNGGTTATTNAQGRFTVQVPYGWTGELTMSKEGFEFEPSTIPYYDVRSNIPSEPETSSTSLPRETAPPDGMGTPLPGLSTTEEPDTISPEGRPLPQLPDQTTTEQPIDDGRELTPLEKAILEMQEKLQVLIDEQKGVTTEEPNLIVEEPIPTITNTFFEEDLVVALQEMATMAGIPIIPDETVLGIVSAELTDVPLDKALEIVLAGTPYVVKKTDDYYLVASAGVTDKMFAVVSETQRIKLSYITAEAAVGLLSTAFRPYVQAEVGPPGSSTYTVTVTAPPALMERIVADIKDIDRLPPHVLLDARIVVMERGNLLNMGVSWNWPTISTGLFSNDLNGRADTATLDLGGKIATGLQIGYTPDATFTNSLEVALNLLESNNEATVLAKPQVLAQDGKVAQINVTTEEYYLISTPESFFTISRSELEKIESGTKLNIIPHIGDNNDITLDLAIEVSDSIPQGTANNLPVVTRRTATNTVRIKDGGTVALAGLTEDRTRLDKRNVPGLSKIPLIGGLFKNKADTKSAREIAVFITANIIPDTGQPLGFAPAPYQQTTMQNTPTGARLGGLGEQRSFRDQLRGSLRRPTR